MGKAKEAPPDLFPISGEMFFAHVDVLDLSLAFDECTATIDIVKVSQDPGRDVIH